MLFFIILLTFPITVIYTAKYIYVGSEWLHPVDTSIHPCDDFYAYACNHWIKDNPIPDGRSEWGQTDKLEQSIQLVVKTMLERPISSFKSEAEIKTKLYYQSCMDEETLETYGAQPLQALLLQIGGWNVTSSGFNVSNWSLSKTMKMMHKQYDMGTGGLLTYDVSADARNSSRHLIYIDQCVLLFGRRDVYLNHTEYHTALSAYLDFMTRVVVLLGGNEIDARDQMMAVIKFEKRAEITDPPEERHNVELIYNVMSVRELQQLASFIDWRDHFNDVLQLVNKRKMNNKDLVVVMAPEYFKQLTNIINEYNATNNGKITLNNYLVWTIVHKFRTYLSKAFYDAYEDLLKDVTFDNYYRERWLQCVAETERALGFAVGSMFVREAFRSDAKKRAERMSNQILTAFQKNLQMVDWMDEDTHILANEKVMALSNMIGFPDYILNSTQLDDYYKELHVDTGKYFENSIRTNVFHLKMNLKKFDKPVKKRWEMIPTTVGAYHGSSTNVIVVPAGMLQTPFFHIKNRMSLNFGAMGYVMGHEITHAFDNNGRKFDQFGCLRQWWSNKTIKRFTKRTNCFVKQYEKFKINEKKLNGKLTLNENIADNVGLKVAFNAYKTSKSESYVDMLASSGMNLTQRQLFFLSFAQIWCKAIDDEKTDLDIEVSRHSPTKFRVIGPLSNLPEFSDEFQWISYESEEKMQNLVMKFTGRIYRIRVSRDRFNIL